MRDPEQDYDSIWLSEEDQNMASILYHESYTKNCPFAYWYYTTRNVRQLELIQEVILDNLAKF